MDRLLPELFPLILKQIPLIYRSSTLLSLALTSHAIYNIVVPGLLFKEVQYSNEEDAIENLKRLVDNAQQIDQPLAHHIYNLCIITTLRLPLSDPEETSLGCLKKLIDINGLRNLKALTIKLCAAQGSPDGRFLDFPLLPALWDSADNHCPSLERVDVNGFVQNYSRCKEWIPRENASSTAVRSLHLEGIVLLTPGIPETEWKNLPPFPVDLTSLKANVTSANSQGRPVGQLFTMIIPKLILPNSYKSLHTLILNRVDNGDIPMKPFWKANSNLERLELQESVTGTWFDDFEEGMLPNLKFLTAGFSVQVHLVIPYLRCQLIGLAIPSSYNGQALYLLRGITDGKIFPQLRYLGIHLVVTSVAHERSDWREPQSDEISPPEPYGLSGEITRCFDKSYITSISKAAPYLDTLELLGPSLDSTRALVTAFSRLPYLRHLILSGAAHFVFEPFFDSSRLWVEYGRYNPSVAYAMMWSGDPNQGFDTLALFLANQCKSLEVFTMGYKLGDLLIEPGVSAKIIRDSNGVVQSLQRIPPRGNTFGREEDWY